GSEYAFANAGRLQQGLAEAGIRYFHFLDLAPSPETRAREAERDRAAGTAKRAREALSQDFADEYREECLSDFDSSAFLERHRLRGPQRAPTLARPHRRARGPGIRRGRGLGGGRHPAGPPGAPAHGRPERPHPPEDGADEPPGGFHPAAHAAPVRRHRRAV